METNKPPPILNYRQPVLDGAHTRAATELLRAAAFFGTLPLVLGFADFVTWIFTRSRSLAFLGLGIIALGVLFSLMGGCCLLGYFLSLSPEPPGRLATFLRRGWVAILLLAINYPAAYAIVRAAEYIEMRWPVPGSALPAD